MEGVSADSLRVLAPKWSLAGDDQLLNLLQNTHQKIISKCRDVNSRLEEMASALDDAGINLQNVNNKFMALSNSQFIESRVYDDDADVTADTRPVEEHSQPSAGDDISSLRASVAALERAHESAEIVDESDSDSDTEISVVLKPRDMYPERPLPHIIGTQAWRNKWHAGLIVEDSDTDSSTSKRDRDIDQYSDSEEEMTRPPLEEQTLSESSSSLPSLGAPPAAGAPGAAPAPRPADIAAALARRLAGNPATLVQEEVEEYPPAAPAQPRKVYKPELPATSAVFSDEPPPLDASSEHSSEEDIFAEINKHKPYTKRNRVQSNLAEDLFSFEKPAVDDGDIFSDFAHTHEEKPPAMPKSTLFEGESEPELFAEPPHRKETQISNIEKEEISTKKPVGGISLFGSNKGTESIGAAILKRNQRKSSASGDESGSDDTRLADNTRKIIPQSPKAFTRNDVKTEPKATINKTIDETDKSIARNEKDIFDDLFSKSEKLQKNTTRPSKEPIKEKLTTVKEKEKTNVKDLFSDNIFDDIDDIFTSDVKIPTKQSNQKSIFEDDDLFSDFDTAKITNPSPHNKENAKDNKTNVKDVKASTKDGKSIFDSDDELFSDIKTDAEKPVAKSMESHAAKHNLTNNEKNIENDVDVEVINQTNDIGTPAETKKERSLFDDSARIVKSQSSKPQIKSKGIFDSDSDDDIFANLKTPDDRKTNNVENKFDLSKNENGKDLLKKENKITVKNLLPTDNINANKEKNVIQSPSLFEEDEIDDLFIAANKLKMESNEHKDSKIVVFKNKPSDEKERFNEYTSKLNEINNSTKSDNIEKKCLAKNAILPESTLDLEPGTAKELDPNQENLFGKNDTLDDLHEDDLFSTRNDVLKNKISEKVTEIADVESSREISESETEKTKPQSKALTGSKLEDTETLEPERDIISQNHDEENVNQSVFDDCIVSTNEKDVFTTEPQIPVPNVDIFGDIITEPPAFEKPVEPKKSKNINALFDDDSDDESLFFKKDDPISDEKPEIFSKNANFDIFFSEPPAIDVDFTTKPTKNTVTSDDLFSPTPKLDNFVNTAKRKQDTFSPDTVEESVSKITGNINADDEDKLFTAIPEKHNVPKSMEIDVNVPVTQENVPDTVRENNIVVDKHKIINKVSETKPLGNLLTELEDKDCNLLTELEDKDLFSPEIVNNTDNAEEESKVIIDSDDELFASLPDLPKSSQKNQNKAIQSAQNDLKSGIQEDKMEEFDDMFKSESPKKDTEIKKIGKLNTKNFNINVNALMPGASPKKKPKEHKADQNTETEEPKMVKIIPDETDFSTKLTSNKDDMEVTDQRDPKTDKSITFEENTESGVLDNNASKQRPRIQVKRRPSSRKARHEAVRKSAIDFGDDTDNSSSFDEPKPINNDKDLNIDDNLSKEDTNLSKETENLFKSIINEDNIVKKEQKAVKSLLKGDDSDDNAKIIKGQYSETQKEDVPEENIDIFESISTNLPHKDSATPSISKETKDTRHDVTEDLNENKQTTTKIVYVLNDEDIFNTKPRNEKKTENILESSEGIQTLGNTYKENAEKKNKADFTSKSSKEEIKNKDNTSTKELKPKKDKKNSIFDDSDEELFNKNKKNVKKTTIFDSDSEEDLFSGKKSTEKKNKEVRNREVKERKEVVVKGSLFGDDDDDDLFNLNVKKDRVAKPKQSTQVPPKEASTLSTASKSAEPVFEDPLSMLGDDD